MAGTKANHISGPFSFWKANMQLFLRTALSSSKIYWLPCFCSYATHSLSCSPVFMSIKVLWKRWHWWLLLYFSLLSYSLQLEDNVESLCLACTKLYQVLNEGNMLGKRFKRRSMLLKTLYKQDYRIDFHQWELFQFAEHPFYFHLALCEVIEF